MLMNVYETKRIGKTVKLDSNNGLSMTSSDPVLILSALARYPGDVNVVFDAMKFYQPIFTLLPKEVVGQLMDGKAATWAGFRLWFGITRHSRVIGITYLEKLSGNVCRRVEKEIYEIKQYYSEVENPSLEETAGLATKLLDTLKEMGLPTKKLTSAATIFKETILDKMPIPSLLNMKEESIETHELALENEHEWVADFKSDSGQSKVYSYDLTAAYPAALAELPNLHWVKSYEHLTEMPPPGACYGIMRGIVHNKTLLSPLIRPETGRVDTGFWEGTMNTWEYGCYMQWGIADFEMKDGWFIYLGKDNRLFDYSMKRLYSFRNGDNKLQDTLAKAMAVSVWGRFLEMHGDDYGDYYNPIYADMVTSLVRIKVCDFIYSNKLQNDIISITVDGVKAKKLLDIPTRREFGKWRFNE